MKFENTFVLENKSMRQISIEIQDPVREGSGEYSSLCILKGIDLDLNKKIFGLTPQQSFLIAVRRTFFHLQNCSEFKSGKVHVKIGNELVPANDEILGINQLVEW